MSTAIFAENDKNPEKNLQNSMDSILVNYGISLSEEERRAIRYGDDKKEIKALKDKIKTCTVPEFLAIDPKNLKDTEQKIQTALRAVYEINGKEPPLYEKFPTFRSDIHPLTIDITTAGLGKNCAAAYHPDDNTIEFVQTNNINNLIDSIAHELKHAEQEDEEVYKLCNALKENNAYGYHQLRFLQEAQAYFCGTRAKYIATNKNFDNVSSSYIRKYNELSQQYANPKLLEKEFIRSILNERLFSGPYKVKYDYTAPIGESDPGLDHLPEVFHLSADVLDILKETPKIAITPEGKLKQALKNNQWAQYLQLMNQKNIEKGKPELTLADALIMITNFGKNQKIKSFMDYVISEKSKNWFLTEKDFIDENKNNLLLENFSTFTEEDRSHLMKVLPQILKLKGSDGKPLVGKKYLTQKLGEWVGDVNLSKNIQNLFTNVLDIVPLIEKDFIDENKNNLLLRNLFTFSEEDRSHLMQVLPQILKLKGNDGKSIINIQAISKENRTLISAIKAYKRQQLKDRLKKLLSFGSRQTENTEIKKEWKEKVEELKREKKKDKKGRSDTLKKVLKVSSNEGKKEALKGFHSQQSPVGVKRRTALKFDR